MQSMSDIKDEVLHSWLLFMQNKASIQTYWMPSYEERLVETISKYPFPEIALFFHIEKLGILSVLWDKKQGLSSTEAQMVQTIVTDIKFNPFCILQMFLGSHCGTCPVKLSGACEPQHEWRKVDNRFFWCDGNKIVQRIKKITTLQQYAIKMILLDFFELKKMILGNYLDEDVMGWGKLIKYVEKSLKKEAVKDGKKIKKVKED